MKSRMLTLAAAVLAVALEARAESGYWDRSVGDFPRLADESDDSPRLQRAVDACRGGVLFVPAGEYHLTKTLAITNFCSVLMHRNARLRAARPMDFVVRVNFSPVFSAYEKLDYGTFFKGGCVDGDGIASCMSVHGYIHLTLRDLQFHNGRKFGLRIKGEEGPGGGELNASNLHFVNKSKGNAGNIAVEVNGCDDNLTDCWTCDYTVGFKVTGCNNYLTRCHSWGGVIGSVDGEMPEYLKDSVGFWIFGGNNTVLRDCYADTATTGFLLNGWETRIFGATYLYNTGCLKGVKRDNLDVVRAFRQTDGNALVIGADIISPKLPGFEVYEGTGNTKFSDMIYAGMHTPRNTPARCVMRIDGGQEL